MMKKKRIGYGTIVVALAGLLGLSAVTFTLGQRESVSNPDVTSFGPSGAAAFAELLRRQGYRVQSNEGTRLHAASDTLLIAFSVPLPPKQPTFSGDVEIPEAEGNGLKEPLKEHFARGGNALILSLPRDFAKASLESSGQSETAHWVADTQNAAREHPDKTVTLDWSNARLDWSDSYPWLMNNGLPVWKGRSSVQFELYGIDRGLCGFAPAGIGATNRFLKEHDNAELFLNCVSLLAKPGSDVMFLEAAHRPPVEPSLFEIIGPWAVAIWWQAVFLFLLAAFALGKRFGLQDEEKSREAGSKDLADALMGVMSRARATDLAMSVLYAEADRQIRRQLKLPMDAPSAHRDERLPPGLRMALRECEVLSKERAPRQAATEVAKKLDSELLTFLGTRTVRRPARR